MVWLEGMFVFSISRFVTSQDGVVSTYRSHEVSEHRNMNNTQDYSINSALFIIIPSSPASALSQSNSQADRRLISSGRGFESISDVEIHPI